MIYRGLTSEDFLALKELLAEQLTFISLPTAELPGLLSKPVMSRLLINLIEQADELVVGAFTTDNYLQGAGFISFSPKRSTWVAKLIVIREALKGKGKNLGLPAGLFEAITATAEARGYNFHIMLVPAAHVTAHGTWAQTPLRTKYINTCTELVPAGQFPKDPMFRELLFGAQPFPIDMMVRTSKRT